MSTSALASLRFPVSLAAGGLFTMTLFWVLWSFTNETFQYSVLETVEIEFTRQVRDTPPVPTQDPKVQREAPSRVIEPPRITIGPPGEIGPTVFERTTPDLPRGTGIEMAGRDGDATPMFRVEAVYPPTAAARGQEGWVQVQYNVSASGAVANASIVGSEPGTVFDAAALTAVSRWRFSPRVVDGVPVERVGMQTMIRFNLEEE